MHPKGCSPPNTCRGCKELLRPKSSMKPPLPSSLLLRTHLRIPPTSKALSGGKGLLIQHHRPWDMAQHLSITRDEAQGLAEQVGAHGNWMETPNLTAQSPPTPPTQYFTLKVKLKSLLCLLNPPQLLQPLGISGASHKKPRLSQALAFSSACSLHGLASFCSAPGHRSQPPA